MPDDPSQLYAVAAELDRQAQTLRGRAVALATDPERVRWSSPGARAWAESVARIRDALTRAADDLARAAAALRTSARPDRTAGR